MNYGIDEKVAVVTGGSSGIGLATGDRRIFSAAAEFAGESSGTDRQDRSSRRSRGGGDSV